MGGEKEDRGTVEIRASCATRSSTMHVAPTLHLPQDCLPGRNVKWALDVNVLSGNEVNGEGRT